MFFVKGVILVEGWAEEILLPSIAKAINIDLTEKGVSIVNIGNTGFDHYAKIYIRQTEPFMGIPVAVITDSDIREYEKNGNEIIKRDENIVEQEKIKKLEEINKKSEGNVKYFAAPNWTLEYSLFKSQSLTMLFQNAAKEIHSGTDWDTDFEKALAEKLINKGFKKTDIAYHIANAIDEDLRKEVPTIQIIDDENDSINYLIKAIKYASGN